MAENPPQYFVECRRPSCLVHALAFPCNSHSGRKGTFDPLWWAAPLHPCIDNPKAGHPRRRNAHPALEKACPPLSSLSFGSMRAHHLSIAPLVSDENVLPFSCVSKCVILKMFRDDISQNRKENKKETLLITKTSNEPNWLIGFLLVLLSIQSATSTP